MKKSPLSETANPPVANGPRQQVASAIAATERVEEKQSLRGGAKRNRGRGNRKGFAARKFPANVLEDALRIPTTIKQFNGGNPWPPKDVAKAVGLSVKNAKFYYLTASSRDYGLTSGSSLAKEIALTDLGYRLVYSASPEAEAHAVREALFQVETFKGVFEHYNGGQLPDLKYLSNTLESQFKLPPNLHDEFQGFYKANCAYLQRFEALFTNDGGHTPTVGGSRPIIVGQPKSKTELRAFVAMPFVEKTGSYPTKFFEEVLRNLITPAGVEAGFKVETARRDGSDIIQSTIVNELLEADLVIIDLTEHNPNVLFELGLRIAFEKPIALNQSRGNSSCLRRRRNVAGS